ncbi:hypothetical protein ACSC1U_09680 [Mammaliicoccus lentus]
MMRIITFHFAFIVFLAEVINELFKEESVLIPIDSLEELDANKNHVFQGYLLTNATHAISNQKGLFLTIDLLKKLKEDYI